MTEGGCSTSEDGAKRRCTAGIGSMTTFFESSDLMRHMFECIKKGDRQHATLVCRGWKDVSYTMPTWRKGRFSVEHVGGLYMKTIPRSISEVSRLSLKEILVKQKHVVQFALFHLDYELWADLAPSMAHVQWLHLVVHMREGWGEMEPFRMDGLPSLTYLKLTRNHDSLPRHFYGLPTSLALHSPPSLSLNHIASGPSHGLVSQCPKLETLDFSVMKGMVIAPSLFSNLRSLTARFYTIPDSMLDANGTELVLGTCPHLTSLTFDFIVWCNPITSLKLDMPSLEHLSLSNNHSLETLRLTCPKLVHVNMGSCPRLSVPPTLMAQLTRFGGEVEQMVAHRTHGNEANYRHVIEGWLLLESLYLGESRNKGIYFVDDLRGSCVDVTLVCPSLRDLSITRMKKLKTRKVVSPVLSALFVASCPRLDVSSMIQPSLENVDVHKCNLKEGTEWTLPNLRELDLGDVKTFHITVNYAPPMSDGIDNGGQVHQLSVDWKNSRGDRRRPLSFDYGIILRVSKDHTLFLNAKDQATKLRILAPSATKLHLEGCGALDELDIDRRLPIELVGNFPAKIREMVDSFHANAHA